VIALLWWAVKMLDKGHPVIIYPEGGIRLDGRMRPLQPGAAWLALRSRVPVVVCVLRGGYAIWPRWAKLPRLTGRLELRIGEPLRIPEAAGGKVTGEMIETVTRRIADEMARLENQGASEPGA
jgi:1-acyl-sn-glycerol-3-phosphate acyltransferase